MECLHAPKKPAFIDDEDKEKPSKSSASGTGRKPDIASSDLFFQLVWKQVGIELKRFIFFIDAFPDSATYDALPLEVFTTAVHAVSKTGCYNEKTAHARGEKEFNTDWSSSVSCG